PVRETEVGATGVCALEPLGCVAESALPVGRAEAGPVGVRASHFVRLPVERHSRPGRAAVECPEVAVGILPRQDFTDKEGVAGPVGDGGDADTLARGVIEETAELSPADPWLAAAANQGAPVCAPDPVPADPRSSLRRVRPARGFPRSTGWGRR